MSVPAVLRPSWVTAGCGPACRLVRAVPLGSRSLHDLVLHDPGTHERHGRDGVLAEQAARLTGTVTVGCLTVDFDARIVTVDGAPVHLTPREHEIVSYLASRAGQVCRYAEVVAAVWGTAELAVQTRPRARHGDRWHLTRAHFCRLRARLGPAARLIQTVPATGYRLRDPEAPDADA